MDSWVLVADQPRDLVARDLPHVIVSSEDYVARPYMFGGARQKIIILARSYNYQTAAYYCALLAEARGHRVMPSVETMLDLRSRAHYQHALPELEEALNRELKNAPGDLPKRALRRLWAVRDAGLRALLAAPLRLVPRPHAHRDASSGNGWHAIQKIELTPLSRCSPAQNAFFAARAQVLYRPQMAGAQAALGAAPLDRRPLRSEGAAPAEHAQDADALGQGGCPAGRRGRADHAKGSRHGWRSSTPCSSARRPRSATTPTGSPAAPMMEGMPVIDDPISMIRCTNKVYLWERLTHAGLPVPETIVIQEPADVDARGRHARLSGGREDSRTARSAAACARRRPWRS